MTLFKRNTVFKSVEDVKQLAEKLSQCPKVAHSGENLKAEAWGLADSIAQVEGSMREFLEDHLPKLKQENLSPSDTFDLLLDIGGEFRHILYHVLEQQSFYRYLVPENMHVFGADEGTKELPKESP
ncbi:MAG: hypothetical protein ACHQWV_03910 [Nitrospirales bacterium]